MIEQNPGDVEVSPKADNELTLEEKVINCFADLFKKQLGLKKRAGAEIAFLESSRFNPKVKTYTAKVKTGLNAWRSRRFTVGPIGEDSGAKSKCFLVIYDNKIVVKVPPTPVTDFDAYINSMKKERRIVDKLHPRECIIPSLGVILNKYQPFLEATASAEGTMEERDQEKVCEAWLRENPEFQEYFMINGGFAYFMDLAKYVFLADAVSLFHNIEGGLQDELLRDPTIIDDFDKFEGRYGLENVQIAMDLKSVYAEFETLLRKMMIRSSVSPSLLLYKTQEWFFVHVAGLQVDKDERDLTPDFVAQLNALLKDIIGKNRDVIDEYRQMVGESIQAVNFSQHKMYMEGLVTNALELLAWLKHKGVAIRDIKPDNLLVAGDPDRYPSFLSFPATYKIGLIDVETAVDFNPEDGKIVQPQLGGTPFYATPANMFANKTLLAGYGDLPRALFLQDWFATMAMIYGIIINDYLFNRTAKQLVVLTRKIQLALKAKQPPEAILKEANNIFWAAAEEEFQENLSKNAKRLRNIRVALQDNVRQLFITEFSLESKRADKAIKKLILQQALFKSQQNQEQLYLGSADRIREVIDKIKNKPDVNPRSLDQLQQIMELKQSVAGYKEIIGLIQGKGSEMPAHYLLEVMFQLACDFMRRL
ncbi:MAG: hypothetical protein AB1724_01745 [Thermodesulfobacteriota bacterium]